MHIVHAAEVHKTNLLAEVCDMGGFASQEVAKAPDHSSVMSNNVKIFNSVQTKGQLSS